MEKFKYELVLGVQARKAVSMFGDLWVQVRKTWFGYSMHASVGVHVGKAVGMGTACECRGTGKKGSW